MRFIWIFCFLIASSAFAQPATDIILADLELQKDKIIIRHAKNITARPGYDNQPFFHPDGASLYFVSADDSARTDIYSYDIQIQGTRRITHTRDKEYSPTVTPDKNFISCILQNDAGAQHLVKYSLQGHNPLVLIDDKIVGYHAWANAENVLVFTLPQPFKLELVDVARKTSVTITDSIGRSLHRIPGTEKLSFLKKVKEGAYEIHSLDANSKTTQLLIKAPGSKEYDMAWTPDGRILVSDGSQLLFAKPGADDTWRSANIEKPFEKNVTRIAISSDGKKIALVIAE
jgi:hypothetical protein